MTTQCIFPAELACQILCYTSPRDVVRWRTVSKWFRAVTHDPAIWKVLYASAHFIRPPGPFPNAACERALVQSERLAQSLITQCLRTVSYVEIPFDGNDVNYHLIGGRWFIVCQSARRFVLHDTNSVNVETRVPQVLWEQEEEIFHRSMHLTTSEEGHWVAYVLLSTTHSQQWTLLEFRLNSESGALCETVTFKLDAPLSGYVPPLNDGKEPFSHSPFLYIPAHSLVFDTRTRIFYEFPQFCLAPDQTQSRINATHGYQRIVPTNIHIIVLRDFPRCHIVVQAFTVPDDQRPVENGNGVLRLSHEGIFQSCYQPPTTIIRNSVVDPITGSINVRLLERPWQCLGFDTTYIDLTLHKPSPVDVSPITIKQHAVTMTGNKPYDGDDLSDYNEYWDVCDDGYARGLLAWGSWCGKNSGIVKFTIDATQDRCVVVLGQDSWLNHLDYPISQAMTYCVSFDGVRGGFSYVTSKGPDPHVMVVFDVD